MMESERLRWLRKNQSKLRVGEYHNLSESISNGDTEGSNLGKRVVLPSYYVGFLGILINYILMEW